MSKDIWSHSHDWDSGYAKGHKDGYEQGYADGSLSVTEEILAHKEKEIRAKVLDEVKNSIHDIYAQNLHCKADMCERETMGYDCEDCLATFLMGYIEDVMKSHNN